MPSPFDEVHAAEYSSAFAEFTETVIRRKGGVESRAEEVNAIVELDSAAAGVAASRGGLLDNQAGEYLEEGALLEVAKTQDTSTNDSWVVDNRVWRTLGTAPGSDAASKTIVLVRRTGRRGREPRVTGGRS